jgi:hypothetical protein
MQSIVRRSPAQNQKGNLAFPADPVNFPEHIRGCPQLADDRMKVRYGEIIRSKRPSKPVYFKAFLGQSQGKTSADA